MGASTSGPLWTAEEVRLLTEMWLAKVEKDGVLHDEFSSRVIGERIGRNKNMVVGKAHRLGLPSRSSPIRWEGGGEAPRHGRRPVKAPAPGVSTLPPLPVVHPDPELQPQLTPDARAMPVADVPPPPRPTPLPSAALEAARKPGAGAVIFRLVVPAKPRPTPAPTTTRTYRSRRGPYGEGCQFPMGDPGTRGFRFCCDDLKEGSPYCEGHHKLCFIKDHQAA